MGGTIDIKEFLNAEIHRVAEEIVVDFGRVKPSSELFEHHVAQVEHRIHALLGHPQEDK